MKIKEIAKTLANKINQEHYIMHYLEKIQRGSYNKGFKDAQSKKLTLTDVGKWVMCKDKLPYDVENYLVEGDGQYAVTFYSIRRKEWNVDFKVTKYRDIPK